MRSRVILAASIVCCCCAVARAASTVHTGSYFFYENTTDNKVQITGTNDAGDTTAAMNFVVGIGDEHSAGQPLITDVDLLTGTVFEANNTGQFFPSFPPPGYVVVGAIVTESAAVSTAGLLGTLTIDTTGVAPGEYDLKLKKDFGAPLVSFNFFTMPALYDLGTITVLPIPEPTSLLLGTIALAALGAVAVRRCRQPAV